MQDLIRHCIAYALSKPGAQLPYGGNTWNERDSRPCVKISTCGGWGEFFEVDRVKGSKGAQLPVTEADRETLFARHPELRPGSWTARDGHVYMAVPFSADLPRETWEKFIDDAHALVWGKTSEHERRQIALAASAEPEPRVIDLLIDAYELQAHRGAIHALAKPALLLATTPLAVPPPIGCSRIGGTPDLPADASWPVFTDGRPLAFLAQVDLREVAAHGSPLPGLPEAGLLSLFSAWGWQSPEEGDPQVPDTGWEDQSGWTAILHFPAGTELQPRPTPAGVNAFPAAAAELRPLLSLPNSRDEPPLASMGLSEEDSEAFDKLQSDFRSLQMARHFRDWNAGRSTHQLGGYALFQQEYPPGLAERNLTMLLQIGSDDAAEMGWGDGGELTFHVDSDALRAGRFERPWCEYQCG